MVSSSLGCAPREILRSHPHAGLQRGWGECLGSPGGYRGWEGILSVQVDAMYNTYTDFLQLRLYTQDLDLLYKSAILNKS